MKYPNLIECHHSVTISLLIVIIDSINFVHFALSLFLQHYFSDVYNQILSTLTLTQVTKIFEQRKNFDLRRFLAGSERLIDHLLTNDSQKRAMCNKSKCIEMLSAKKLYFRIQSKKISFWKMSGNLFFSYLCFSFYVCI